MEVARTSSRFIAPLLTLAVLSLASHCSLAQQSDKPPAVTIETILKAWHDRQQAAKSFHIEWKERLRVRPGEMGKKGGTEDPPDSDEMITFDDLAFSWTADGEKFRIFQDYVVGGETLDRQKTESAFNGTLYKTLQHETEHYKITQGTFLDSLEHVNIGECPHFLPLAIDLRPFSPIFEVIEKRKDRLTVTQQRELINGRESLLVIEEHDGNGAYYSIWVDPERDFVVTRLLFTVRGSVGAQYDLNDFKQIEGIWVPMGWTVEFRNPDGSNSISQAATVTKAEVNQNVDEEIFQFEFPAGTLVFKGDDHYLAREGGELRKLLREEMQGGYSREELLNSEPGELFRKRGEPAQKRWLWVVTANAVLAVALLLMFLWRRRSLRNT